MPLVLFLCVAGAQEDWVLEKCFALVLKVEGLENANVAQQLEIIKLKARVKKLERLNKVKSSKLRRLKKVGTSQRVESSEDEENVFNQGRISVDMDQDERVELVLDQEKNAKEDTEVQEAVEVVTTAKLITEVVNAAATQVAAASAPIPAAKPKVLKIAAALAVSTRRRKGVVIRNPKEELHVDTPAETPIVKDKGKGILIKDPKPMKKKEQVKMDAEEEIEKEDEEIIKSINETPAHKAAKKRKLSEEAQEADNLRGRLEIVPEEDDDVFVEAIPLAQKASVVDYQKLEIIKLKARVKRLEKANKVKSLKLRRLRKVGASKRVESSDDMEDVFNQGRMIDDLDKDEGIELDKGKGILVETPNPIKKKDQIELDAEYARKLHEEINQDHEEINKDIDWDAAIDHVYQKSKNPQYIKRYQGMKKRPQTESEARKNMMIYLKNTASYKMDFFKGMSYAKICLIFQARFDENMRFLFKSREEMEEEDQEIIKSINETPAQKAAKRRKLSEEA
nr:hypothetical protein [Tanacetum cinerariifolium]